jgi:phosphoenolpyruvate synthase/pyruvate phosphate dikinase
MTALELRPTTFRALPGVYCRALFAANDVARVGEKAHALGRVARAGVAVPHGFVLTTDAFDAHLRENDLSERIARECDALDIHDPAAITAASLRIRELVREAPLPPGVQDQCLMSAESLLARGLVVVRSSALGEDGEGQSFAGQLDSILHVSTATSLFRAVADVWSSFWSERALFYRAARGVAAR